ncbi:hypothetical protein PIROE2DRAFT_9356 [Piromyces sp. E2]|nr:hypothetical protein PIROE2DRAFT_9356 [Piromyces sp. E2]|eukprot:OUM63973.1 hypothetical protein PIROE2DRAFT_9356 [Piromyces sp. E2]
MNKYNNLYIVVGIIISYLINCVQAMGVENDEEDKYYLLFVKNEYSENGHNKRQEVSDSVYDLIDNIHNLIMNNTNTFKDPSKIFEIEKNNKLKKRNEEIIYLMEHGKSDIVYPISSHKKKTILYTFLSSLLAKKIRLYPNVIACIPNQKLTLNSVETIDKQQIQIEIDVKNETHWKDISIRENADLHLSLISQGKFNKTINSKYDTNYYYPSTAGQDVDIYIVDTGFDFRHPEFSNKKDREAKCLYYINYGGILTSPHEDYCYSKQPQNTHGLTSSDIAAGLIHGVASKANVYGIVIDEWTSDLFVVLQYVKDNILRPNKTVFNFSLGGYFHNEEHKELINYWRELIDSITEKGAIIVSGAGNNYGSIDLVEYNKSFYPCSFKNVICVGAIDNYGLNEKELYDIPEVKVMKTKYYRKAQYCNIGKSIDIFAPGCVVSEFKNKNGKNIKYTNLGTSFSTPIVSGVIACFISENSHIDFDCESMRQYLWKLGEKDIIDDIPEGIPNIFINNGKHIIYPGDGEEESEYEIDLDYDKPINYNNYDSKTYFDFEEHYTGLPIYNEYSTDHPENPSIYNESPSEYYEYPSNYNEEYYEYSEYEKPTNYVYRFEEHNWPKDFILE